MPYKRPTQVRQRPKKTTRVVVQPLSHRLNNFNKSYHAQAKGF